MQFLPQNKCQWIGLVVHSAVFATWEFWLGRTDKVKASSTGELILFGVQWLWGVIKRKGAKDEHGTQGTDSGSPGPR